MRFAIIDNRMSEELVNALSSYVDKIIKLPAHPLLPSPVASHPDMLLWIYGKLVVTYKDYISLAMDTFELLENLGYTIIAHSESPDAQYPRDVALNCALVGKRIIANERYMSDKIKDIAKQNELQTVNVNQGYAKCSTVIVSDNAIITSDPSIARAATAADIDVLKIRPYYVSLYGYDTGFLGGASGCTETEVIFCGDLVSHPDADLIKCFCLNHGKRAVSLGNAPLYDYGTVFFVNNEED